MTTDTPTLLKHGPSPDASAGEYLTFRLGDEEYGVNLAHVQEIRSYEPPMRIANALPEVKGVLNLRGTMVPIVDLRVRLAYANADVGALTVVIVLNLRDRVAGVVVDSVSDVVNLTDVEIKRPPGVETALERGWLIGVGCLEGELGSRTLLLMDIHTLLCSEGAERARCSATLTTSDGLVMSQ